MRSYSRSSAIQCLLTVICLASAPLQAQDVWDRADQQTRRLAPAAFGRLPSAVRADLERRGCTVPQLWLDSLPANVISGHFRTASERDWAILCSVDRRSTILVYWKGLADSVAELASQADRDYLQVVAVGTIGFSRALVVVDSGFIRSHYARYGGPRPPPLDHEGISDAFSGKGSVVWYWHRGQWLQLTGGD